MRNKIAKAIKRHVYGDYSSKGRKYNRLETGEIIADPLRRTYQALKRKYKQ